MSKYADNLVLKDGLFIYTLTKFESRATVHMDFLMRQLPNSDDEIENQMISKWKLYLRTIKMPELDFKTVIESIYKLQEPIWNAIVNEDECFKKWDENEGKWK